MQKHDIPCARANPNTLELIKILQILHFLIKCHLVDKTIKILFTLWWVLYAVCNSMRGDLSARVAAVNFPGKLKLKTTVGLVLRLFILQKKKIVKEKCHDDGVFK